MEDLAWQYREGGSYDPLAKKAIGRAVQDKYGNWHLEKNFSSEHTMVDNAALAKMVNEVAVARKTIADLEAQIKQLEIERDSACASFSEALKQAQNAELELQRKRPTAGQVFKLANAALELAEYAQALEGAGKGNTPGSRILKVRELVKGMV